MHGGIGKKRRYRNVPVRDKPEIRVPLGRGRGRRGRGVCASLASVAIDLPRLFLVAHRNGSDSRDP